MRASRTVAPGLIGLSLLVLSTWTVTCDSVPTENSNTFARITNDQASMRIDPTTISSEVAFLDRGLKVQVIGRSDEQQAISGHREYWYRIRLPNDMEGWVYGASLSIGNAGEAPAEPEVGRKELALSLVGKWWEVRTDGTTGYRRLYFWADGAYKYAYGTDGPMKEGRYEIQADSQTIKLDPPAGLGETVQIKKLGTEWRLFAETDGRRISLRRAFLDPDAPDPDAPDSDEQSEEQNEALASPPGSGAASGGSDESAADSAEAP